MAVWILHQKLNAEEEAHIHNRGYVVLPFDHLPDLSSVSSEGKCRQLMAALHPDDPPESITLKSDRIWRMAAGLHKEDMIAVPLKNREEIALAQVTGGYRYQPEEGGSDIHLMPVTWYPKNVPLRRLSKHKTLFIDSGAPMMEVMDSEARIAICDQLPHSYNRFARWKWLMLVFFAIGAISLLRQMMSGQ